MEKKNKRRMTATDKIKKDVEKILKSVVLLEEEHSNFHSPENKKDFEYSLERAKVFLNGTKMIVARDYEHEKMIEATRPVNR